MLTALAVAAAIHQWNDPGQHPFMGDVPAAVDTYTDIPPATRERIKARMRAWQYEDLPTITRDGVRGSCRYENLRDMHFGDGRLVRGLISTAHWPASWTERGPVYCEDGHCIIVPTVCRNVSRIDRIDESCEQSPPAEPPRARTLETPAGWASSVAADPVPAADVPVLELSPPPVETLAIPAGEAPLQWGLELPPLPVIWGWPTVFATVTPPTGFTPWRGMIHGPVCVGNPGEACSMPSVSPIPEPSTWLLMALGLIGVFVAARARREGE